MATKTYRLKTLEELRADPRYIEDGDGDHTFDGKYNCITNDMLELAIVFDHDYSLYPEYTDDTHYTYLRWMVVEVPQLTPLEKALKILGEEL